ncbi:hypothetical protein E4U55_005381 [Claviceps digitariae]|nr:hypothetical protein E4U55_005381 [Claviceps digitariae]
MPGCNKLVTTLELQRGDGFPARVPAYRGIRTPAPAPPHPFPLPHCCDALCFNLTCHPSRLTTDTEYHRRPSSPNTVADYQCRLPAPLSCPAQQLNNLYAAFSIVYKTARACFHNTPNQQNVDIPSALTLRFRPLPSPSRAQLTFLSDLP